MNRGVLENLRNIGFKDMVDVIIKHGGKLYKQIGGNTGGENITYGGENITYGGENITYGGGDGDDKDDEFNTFDY